MTTIIKMLMMAAISLSGYQGNKDVAPAIKPVSKTYLEHVICSDEDYLRDGKCGTVYGFYHNGVVYIDENLDIRFNKLHRSVVVHEFVHYLQERNNKYNPAHQNICTKIIRELEAFQVEMKYLAREGVTRQNVSDVKMYDAIIAGSARLKQKHAEDCK